MILKYKDKPWNWSYFSETIDLSFIVANHDLKWDWYGVASRNDTTCKILDLLPNKSWDWNAITAYEDFNIAFLLKYKDIGLNWLYISKHHLITMDDVKTYDLPWDYAGLSRNPNLTVDFVKKHKEKLDFREISKNLFLNNQECTTFKRYVSELLPLPNVLIPIITDYF